MYILLSDVAIASFVGAGGVLLGTLISPILELLNFKVKNKHSRKEKEKQKAYSSILNITKVLFQMLNKLDFIFDYNSIENPDKQDLEKFVDDFDLKIDQMNELRSTFYIVIYELNDDLFERLLNVTGDWRTFVKSVHDDILNDDLLSEKSMKLYKIFEMQTYLFIKESRGYLND